MFIEPLQFIGLAIFFIDSIFLVAADIRNNHKLTVHQGLTNIIPLLAICAFIASDPSYLATKYAPFSALGILLLIGGLVFRRYALSHLKGNAEDFWIARNNPQRIYVVASGPYQYIRHPLYSSLLLYYLGVTCLFFHPVTILVFALFAAALVLTAFEEEKFLRQTFSEYSDIMQGTGMFIPNNLDFLFDDQKINKY